MDKLKKELIKGYDKGRIEGVIKFSRACISEAMHSENIINFGDVGAWKDCLCEIDAFLNSLKEPIKSEECNHKLEESLMFKSLEYCKVCGNYFNPKQT